MNKGLLLSFVCGAIAGAVCIHFIEKSRHEEEIESVKETYRANAGKTVVHMPEEEKPSDKVEAPEEKESVKKNVFTEYRDLTNQYKSARPKKGIYPITPDEFGDEDYDQVTYYYYNDGIVANEDGERIIDLEEKIGDGLDHIGEYEADSAYMRNDNLETDYEILSIDEKYTDYLERVGGRS